ncbi:hypothetical protein BRAS3809_3340005 [Bradyrhizobium sp. STM 3809]|nr:hypothetical protein BRAS3809_3340005 [Bradyrhizobium sp. STM 3809]
MHNTPPSANNVPVRSLRESVLILVVEANSGLTQNPPRDAAVSMPAGFRRLRGDAQSRAASK